MKLHFYLRFYTRHGQNLLISGNTEELGNGNKEDAVEMNYLNNDFWYITIETKKKTLPKLISYKYLLKDENGALMEEWGHDRKIQEELANGAAEIQVIDTWNHAGEYENAFFAAPFREVLLKQASSKTAKKAGNDYTHVFKVKAPLLKKNEAICLLGGCEALGDWETDRCIPLLKEADWWTVRLNLENAEFPVPYKYGIWDAKDKNFVRYEEGNNRLLYSDPVKKKITILHDGFVHLPNNTWKGAGVAIPVFSLKSKNSFGVGEFTDIKLLADWAKETDLKLIQLLPVNDTISTGTWLDSYPYAAISAFALHPLYINLSKIAGKEYAAELKPLKKKQKELNELPAVDYEQVIRLKLSVLKQLYDVMGEGCLGSEEYKKFYKQHQHWLQPYAAFSYYRDKYKTSRFTEWKANSIYDPAETNKLFSSRSASFKEVAFYCFIQYHLHLQLKEAVDYAHKKGVVIKGDIPIGISRNSCDAWVAPELYNMAWQAGAPPDDFTAVGQNWGFPTYNWKRMQQDGFAWWKQRLEQMSHYFDAFRIDHILGFFRIWSIPENAVQGIMGRFVPCLPVHINEFGENGLWFDYQRYCKPYITNEILTGLFGDNAEYVKENFIEPNGFSTYDMKEGFETQQQVEQYFAEKEDEDALDNEKIKSGLFELISNVIFFEEDGSAGEHFHFRISMEKTSSYKHLLPYVQEKLKALYVNYFYRRQDQFWFHEAMTKLPNLKAATNMLVCGEDLGMVPHCVPDVMQRLGILSLEIQRMPKNPGKDFFIPEEAPYMSVITPSTHDMSTIRAWWEENREKTQNFYNQVMGQWGEAPYYCESWVNRAIILQHLYSPAMWSVFQLQDILGMSDTLRRENPKEERINNPANPKNYWQYRIHVYIEDLIKEQEFNEELKGYVMNSGRA